MDIRKIGVHNGYFHADDVFAVAVLKLIYPKAKVVRSRDLGILKKCDVRIDVGMKYDPKKGDFDHHQGNMKESRENGVPYASFGLVWKHFGKKLVGNNEVWEYIDKRFVQPIDANDTGHNIYEAQIDPHTTSKVVDVFNPSWLQQDEKLYDEGFFEILPFAMTLVQKEIQKADGIVKARSIVREKIKEQDAEKKGFLFLEKHIPWKEVVINETSDVKYVVSYHEGYSTWGVEAVRKELVSFENRKDLPKEWGGLANEKLASVTGIKDAVFCHKSLFVISARSKESALKLVKKALKD
ncbi:MAG: MYG1 family protein [Nanoarchaeota archaeon]|nr:MYG1 family protein [Nanoarchaeota archaeon]